MPGIILKFWIVKCKSQTYMGGSMLRIVKNAQNFYIIKQIMSS